MDDISAQLQSLLNQHFQVTPTFTSRRDQWFKRRYQSWTCGDKNKELLVLVPKAARTEWAPEMLRISDCLAKSIYSAAAAERQKQYVSFSPRQDKLFADSVLDEPSLLHPKREDGSPTLHPRAQRGDWWPHQCLYDQAYVIRALIEHEQVAPLLRISQMLDVDFKTAEDPKVVTKWSPQSAADEGWGVVVDEVLQVFFFCAILGAFPEALLTDKCNYTRWLPFGEMLSVQSPAMRFIRELEKRPDFKYLQSQSDLNPHMRRCICILASAQVLYKACDLPAVKWEARISNAMLYFVGFEAWNREREGRDYLACPFNVAKNDKWLTHGVARIEAAVREGSAVFADSRSKSPRSRDPLLLHEPRKSPVAEDNSDDEDDKLAELEAAEAAYGAKRSTKYQRKQWRGSNLY